MLFSMLCNMQLAVLTVFVLQLVDAAVGLVLSREVHTHQVLQRVLGTPGDETGGGGGGGRGGAKVCEGTGTEKIDV